MEYVVEGESLSPEDFSEGLWNVTFRRKVKAHQATVLERKEARENRGTFSNKVALPPPTSGKAALATRPPYEELLHKRRQTLPRLPFDDFKIVFRPRDVDPRALGATKLVAALIQLVQARCQDQGL